MILNKIKKRILVAGALVGSMALAGCSTGAAKVSSEDNNIVIAHELGTTILEEKPKNIAVLELSFLDSLYNLDIDPVTVADDNDEKKVASVTNGELTEYISVGARKEPSLEELSMMDIDLIIADTSRHSEIYDDLSKIAPTIVLNSIDSTYEEYIENFEKIAEAIGEEEMAQANEASLSLEQLVEIDIKTLYIYGVFIFF